MGPFTVEAEGAGSAEELRRVGHDEHGFHANPETPDLAAAFPRHTHPENCLSAFGSDGISSFAQ